MVGGRDDLAVLHAEGIVGLGAAQVRQSEAVAELHALDRGDRKQGVAQKTLHRVEPGLAEAGRQAEDRSLQDAAHAVARFPGGQDRVAHGGSPALVEDGERPGMKQIQVGGKVAEGPVGHAAAAGDVGAEPDLPVPQGGQGDGSDGDQRGGEPPGKPAAAPGIGKAPVFHAGRIVGVAGAGGVL